MAKVKITVLKKLKTGDVLTKYGNNQSEECEMFPLGASFIVEDPNISAECPKGFCSWAFADLQRDIVHLALDGNFPWIKQKGCQISCCTDGLRPVVFKLERVES